MDEARPSPTLALLRRARRAELELARAFDPYGLSVRKNDVLRAIASTPGLSHGDLARRVGIDAAGARSLVRSLVDTGLVREVVTAGGHAPLLSVTDRGAAALVAVDRALGDLDAELFAGESGEELAAALLAEVERMPLPPED